MSTERDGRGRFLPGNPGGPGRPKKEPSNRFHIALEEVVTDREWRRLVRNTLERALDGDLKAMDWLAKHLLGKPKYTVQDVASAASDSSVVVEPANLDACPPVDP